MGREIYDIINDMAEVLNASQMQKLQEVLVKRLSENTVSDYLQTTNMDFLDMFLTAKHLEGCSDKTIRYYRCNIEKMLDTINIPVIKITTEMIRKYLVEYQTINNCGKVRVIVTDVLYMASDIEARVYLNLMEERWMDITYVSNRKKFNYRVCAIIISNSKILAMHDERSPYFYLPGGRVQMGETAEHAVVREVEEELNITPKIIRPLWLNQSFFTEDVDKLNYHEICIYYLMDISETGLLEKGERFTLHEGPHIHDFEWLAFERLQDEYFYPIFLKTNIYNLPKQFTIRTEYE